MGLVRRFSLDDFGSRGGQRSSPRSEKEGVTSWRRWLLSFMTIPLTVIRRHMLATTFRKSSVIPTARPRRPRARLTLSPVSSWAASRESSDFVSFSRRPVTLSSLPRARTSGRRGHYFAALLAGLYDEGASRKSEEA